LPERTPLSSARLLQFYQTAFFLEISRYAGDLFVSLKSFGFYRFCIAHNTSISRITVPKKDQYFQNSVKSPAHPENYIFAGVAY
jgi:hypothetical protein